MAKKKPRARTERRTAARSAVKDAHAALRLAALAPGGSADHPLVVTSASVIEPQAASAPCAVCGASTRVEEHRADPALGLRVVHVRCPTCGVARDLYFRIAQLN
ncbi:MAG: hypothetical protein KIT84_01185 [Labilithrix sp.]|nr:hypothetical protein [Labilithrix sp.]MCW5809599.1 hypothetical protein [Labilithrix sp.]